MGYAEEWYRRYIQKGYGDNALELDTSPTKSIPPYTLPRVTAEEPSTEDAVTEKGTKVADEAPRTRGAVPSVQRPVNGTPKFGYEYEQPDTPDIEAPDISAKIDELYSKYPEFDKDRYAKWYAENYAYPKGSINKSLAPLSSLASALLLAGDAVGASKGGMVNVRSKDPQAVAASYLAAEQARLQKARAEYYDNLRKSLSDAQREYGANRRSEIGNAIRGISTDASNRLNADKFNAANKYDSAKRKSDKDYDKEKSEYETASKIYLSDRKNKQTRENIRLRGSYRGSSKGGGSGTKSKTGQWRFGNGEWLYVPKGRENALIADIIASAKNTRMPNGSNLYSYMQKVYKVSKMDSLGNEYIPSTMSREAVQGMLEYLTDDARRGNARGMYSGGFFRDSIRSSYGEGGSSKKDIDGLFD